MACHRKIRTVIASTARGFTLVELAVTLFIVALVLGSILVPLTTQVEQRKVSDTQKALDEIKEALMGFAIANGRLPCPAQSSTNGVEKAVCSAVVDRAGFIPWVTLGVSKLDAWGHVFRYSVTYTYASSTKFDLTTSGAIDVQTRYGGPTFPLANSVPAVVMSHGKNGYGSVDDVGFVQETPGDWTVPTHTDEYANSTTAILFVSRVPQAPGAGPSTNGGEFDDIVVWISPNILFNRMVAAGKLP